MKPKQNSKHCQQNKTPQPKHRGQLNSVTKGDKTADNIIIKHRIFGYKNKPLPNQKIIMQDGEIWNLENCEIEYNKSQQPLKTPSKKDGGLKYYEGENALKRGAITNGGMESSPALIEGSPADNTQFCLSDKRRTINTVNENYIPEYKYFYPEDDVKQAIKLLKIKIDKLASIKDKKSSERTRIAMGICILEDLDEIFGSKLTEEKS